MPRALVFRHDGELCGFQLDKVDRALLYGSRETIALDEEGRPCRMASLAADGRTVIGAGGTALGFLAVDGRWLDKPALVPVDEAGQRVTPVPSTFDSEVVLERKATVSDLLDHDIRLVYQIVPEMGRTDALLEDLKQGTIWMFSFAFRAGLVADVAFLVCAADGTPFMLVGTPINAHFVGLEETAGAAVEDEVAPEPEGDDLDFGMM